MILIFGGTTEGRLAVEVTELAGKPYFYSTHDGVLGVWCGWHTDHLPSHHAARSKKYASS